MVHNDRKYMHLMDKTMVLDKSLFIMILLSVLDVNTSLVVFLFCKQQSSALGYLMVN